MGSCFLLVRSYLSLTEANAELAGFLRARGNVLVNESLVGNRAGGHQGRTSRGAASSMSNASTRISSSRCTARSRRCASPTCRCWRGHRRSAPRCSRVHCRSRRRAAPERVLARLSSGTALARAARRGSAVAVARGEGRASRCRPAGTSSPITRRVAGCCGRGTQLSRSDHRCERARLGSSAR